MIPNKSQKFLLVFSLILVMSGCSTYSHIPKLADSTNSLVLETPKAFTTQVDVEFKAIDTGAWIAQFNSPELQDLIKTGLNNNPNLAATATRVLDSQILVNISNSNRLPNLNASLSGARAKSHFLGTTFINDDFNLGFSSQWEIDLWGRLGDQAKANALNAEATKQQYNAAKLSLSANIAKAYFNLLTENALVELTQQNTQNIERIESISVRSFKRGLVNALDVQLARRDLANSKRASLAQKNSAEVAARTLDVLLGGYPKGYATNTQSIPNIPNSLDQGIPARVLERRPDLQAAALQILVSEADVNAARKALFPSIVLNGSVGTNTSDLKNIFDKDFSVWSLLGTLAQPVLNRTALKGNLALEKNAQERAKLEYIDLALQAMSEVENALANENSLRDQVIELTNARDYAQQSSNQARQQYEKGLVDANTLLLTESQYLNTEQTLLQTRNLLLQNRVSLYIALGGDTHDFAQTIENTPEGATL